MASYLHKQLMHLKLEGGFGMLEAHIAISMPFTSQNIHCPFIIAFIFQTHFLTVQVNQLQHPHSLALLTTNHFVIYPRLGISRALSY